MPATTSLYTPAPRDRKRARLRRGAPRDLGGLRPCAGPRRRSLERKEGNDANVVKRGAGLLSGGAGREARAESEAGASPSSGRSWCPRTPVRSGTEPVGASVRREVAPRSRPLIPLLQRGAARLGSGSRPQPAPRASGALPGSACPG